MNPVEVRVRFVVGETSDLSAEATDKLREAWAINFLRGRGFNVTAPGAKWETPTEFRTRHKIGWEGIHRALKRPGCPNVVIKWSASRLRPRILGIRSNLDFDAFVVRNKHRRKRLSKT